MVDTVILLSPPILEEIKDAVKDFCTRRIAYEIKTANMIYEFTTAELRNTADSRISVKLCEDEWVRVQGIDNAFKKQCQTYLRVETSVHKQLLGHNCYGGSSDFQLCCKWLINHLNKIFNCVLPNFEDWFVNKVDFAETYNLGSAEAVCSWIHNMNNCEYSRRQKNISRFADTGLYISGASTTVKFYHKGTEFKKHDRKKASKLLDFKQLNQLQNTADKILRIEVEIKIKKLKYDFGFNPCVIDVTTEYLKKVYDGEINKILKGFGDDMKVVNKSQEVERLLYQVYKPAKAGLLLGTWYRLSANGEEAVSKSMNRMTFYRHRKDLLDAGCTWVGSDVVIADTAYPADFIPVRTDRHYFGYCLQEVQDKLNQVA